MFTFPEYTPPEKTGDELYDMMVELSAYREWVRKVEEYRLDRVNYLNNLLSLQTYSATQPSVSIAWAKKNILGL